MNPQDADQVARIAAAQMGAPAPAAAAAPAQPMPGGPAQPMPGGPAAAPAAPQEAPTTNQEAAVQAASPETEADAQGQDPVIYQVDFGGQTRDLTPKQISEVFTRYSDLNHKHASMKPVMQLAEKMVQATGAEPEKVAQYLEAAARAFTKNATMGNVQGQQQQKPETPPPGQQPTAGNLDDEFRKYEEENAITLPPGYREQMDRLGRMEQAIGAQMQMMQRVLGQAQQGAEQGQQAAQSAQSDRSAAIQQAIATNLDRAQQQFGLSDDDANAFMAFAGERGYTLEDFSDPELTLRVVGDFNSAKQGPELERLKQMAQRREAFLQAGSASPASASAVPEGDPTISRLAEGAMKQRFMT